MAREIPTHLMLAMSRNAWEREGWPAMMGRAPTPDDYVIPSRLGAPRGEREVHARLQEDLERLGFGKRRLHDPRRTFVSRCRDDGA